MRPDPGLDALLTALRHAGLTVSVTEILRLQRLFELSPEADLARLRQLVAAVVVKSPEHEARLQEIFEEWLVAAEAAFREREEPPPPPPPPPAAKTRARVPRWLRGAGVATALGAGSNGRPV